MGSTSGLGGGCRSDPIRIGSVCSSGGADGGADAVGGVEAVAGTGMDLRALACGGGGVDGMRGGGALLRRLRGGLFMVDVNVKPTMCS